MNSSDEKKVDEGLGFFQRARKQAEELVDVDRVLASTRTVLEAGSSAADVLVHMGGGLTVPGATALTLRAVNTIRELRSKSAKDHFSQGWKSFHLHSMDHMLFHAFSNDVSVTLEPQPGIYEHESAYESTLEGIEFGWTTSGGHGGERTRQEDVTGAYLREDQDVEQALQVLGRCVWRDKSSMQLQVKKDRQGHIEVVPETDNQIFPSKTGDGIYENFQRRLAKGQNVSAFLIGEPGVGKSKMMRYIGTLHGGCHLRMNLSYMQDLSGSDITNVVKILRPDVLMIDDFDRHVVGYEDSEGGMRAGSMLDSLETINELVPLFVVSANMTRGITKAVLRPGRFDEIWEIESLEPEIYEAMLPGAPASLIKAVIRAKMPVAYVAELAKRAESMDWDWVQAKKELEELATRADRVISLAEKAKKRAARKKQKRYIAGKSQRQKARSYERWADSQERQADRLVVAADRLREKAKKDRERAQEWREKAETAEQKEKEKKAKAKSKKQSSKKSSKKKVSKTKPKTVKATAGIEKTSPKKLREKKAAQRKRSYYKKKRARKRKGP